VNEARMKFFNVALRGEGFSVPPRPAAGGGSEESALGPVGPQKRKGSRSNRDVREKGD